MVTTGNSQVLKSVSADVLSINILIDALRTKMLFNILSIKIF